MRVAARLRPAWAVKPSPRRSGQTECGRIVYHLDPAGARIQLAVETLGASPDGCDFHPPLAITLTRPQRPAQVAGAWVGTIAYGGQGSALIALSFAQHPFGRYPSNNGTYTLRGLADGRSLSGVLDWPQGRFYASARFTGTIDPGGARIELQFTETVAGTHALSATLAR